MTKCGVSIVLTMIATSACTPYRIEYHQRPGFYAQASEKELPSETVLADGTIIKFVEGAPKHTGAGAKGALDLRGAEVIKLRDENDSGSTTLRAYAPEHVLAHAKRGVRSREYRLLWDQLLSERTKEAYKRDGKTYEDFASFCESNRPAMMETFNRMGFGLYSPDVVQESMGGTGFRYRLHPRLADQFVFTQFDIVRENGMLKWAMIK